MDFWRKTIPDSSNSQCKAPETWMTGMPRAEWAKAGVTSDGARKAIRHQIMMVLPYIDGQGKEKCEEIGYHSN